MADNINQIIESEVKKNVDNLFKSDIFDRLIYLSKREIIIFKGTKKKKDHIGKVEFSGFYNLSEFFFKLQFFSRTSKSALTLHSAIKN